VETEHDRADDMRTTLGPFKAGVGRGGLARTGTLPLQPLGSSSISPRSPRATFAQEEAEGRRHWLYAPSQGSPRVLTGCVWR